MVIVSVKIRSEQKLSDVSSVGVLFSSWETARFGACCGRRLFVHPRCTVYFDHELAAAYRSLVFF